MNKKEISEIKKQFKKDGNAIDRIAGCFVDHEKNIRMKDAKAFFTLSEDEVFKYYDIFKKALSGAIGKNLHSLDYSIEQELEGDGHKMLLALKESGLKDEEQLDSFYRKVIENYVYADNYYIVLIHGNYDIPGRGTDDVEMDDASEYVYEYILCCICPVEPSTPGLYYNAEENVVEEREQELWIGLPMNAFLFPAFNDRNTDIHSLLYYTKKPEVLHDEFLDGCIGGPVPMSYNVQKETFQDILAGSLGENCGYSVMTQVHEELAELAAVHAEDPEPPTIDKPQMRRILEDCGVEAENLEQFDRVYDEMAGDRTSFLVNSVAQKKNVEVKTADVKITVPPDCVSIIKTQMIDGRKCLVIPVDNNVEVNGMTVTVDFAGEM